jgi:hypothetical protein
MADDVHDIRFDLFLRAMRDTGSFQHSCEKAGVSSEEVEAKCRAEKKFDLTVVACYLEWSEETLMAKVRESEEIASRTMVQLREEAMRRHKTRHPDDK